MQDLVHRINNILHDLPCLVKPYMVEINNWTLVNDRGNSLDIEAWDAMLHAGQMLMITFDQSYRDGRFEQVASNTKTFRISVKDNDTFGLAIQNDLIVPTTYCLVRIGHHILGKKGRWHCERFESYIVPCSLKVRELFSGVIGTQNVLIRHHCSSSDDSVENLSHRSEKACNELSFNNVVKLDFLGI
jgi:hypothetical protein